MSAPRNARPAGGKDRRAWRRRTEPADHALGRSRGGFGTKLHLADEGGGLPVHVVLSAGQAQESRFVEPVLDEVRVMIDGAPAALERYAAGAYET
jgi:hypothetical protein